MRQVFLTRENHASAMNDGERKNLCERSGVAISVMIGTEPIIDCVRTHPSFASCIASLLLVLVLRADFHPRRSFHAGTRSPPKPFL